MVGEAETQTEYDEEWENLLDSGILEDLIQKAEHENAVKRASQVLPTFSTPQPPQALVPQPNLSADTQIHPRPALSPTDTIPPVAGRALLHNENAFNTRSQALYGSRKPPLPFELKGSQSYYQDRYEGAHQAINLSQIPTQTPGSFRYGTPAHGAVIPPNQSSNGVPGLHRDDGVHVNELLAERNGAISLLRSKLMQADSELYDLRKRVAAQASSQHVPHFQQRELERLSLELSLKDQEVLEARRARDEKDDHLRDALNSAAALKEELENLKRLRKTDAGGAKRFREEGAVVEYEALDRAGPSYSQDEEPEEAIAAYSDRPSQRTYAQLKSQSKRPDQAQETWAAPWETEKPQDVAAQKALTSKESSDAAVLKARTLDDGCVTSNQKKTKVTPIQTSELPCRGETSGRNGASAPAPQQVKAGRGLGLENEAVLREIAHTLQQIWNPKGAQNESVSLVSELFAVCRQELYILLTYDGTLKEVVKNKTVSNNIIGQKRKQALNNELKEKVQEGVGSKFHNVLAKVANKLMPSATLLGPLLEFCNCDNVGLVQCALHVLRCILRHDSFCRDKVLARNNRRISSNSKHGGISESFSRLNFTYGGRGWCIPSSDMRQEHTSVPVFSSLRVFCGTTKLQNEATTGSLGPDQVGRQKNITGDDTPSLRLCSDETDIASLDLDPFVKWLLDMATNSSNSGVRFEATAIMGLLVAHEPIAERAQFGPLIWNANLASLLKKSAGVEVQLQAIRLVHLLLHCPILLQMFYSALDTSLGGCVCTPRLGEPITEEATTYNQGKGDCKIVLDGISSCLESSDSSLQSPDSILQVYALRRDAIRVLAFLASSGDSAVRILFHDQMKLEQSMALKESNNSADGGNGLQSENPRKSSRINADPGASALNSHMGASNEDKCFFIPGRLISLLARELNAEEDEAANSIERMDYEEDRACLIRETVSLLSKLISNHLHSRELLDWIVANKETTRLTLSVIDQLISRGSQSRPGASSSTDLVELARGLQNRIIPEL